MCNLDKKMPNNLEMKELNNLEFNKKKLKFNLNNNKYKPYNKCNMFLNKHIMFSNSQF